MHPDELGTDPIYFFRRARAFFHRPAQRLPVAQREDGLGREEDRRDEDLEEIVYEGTSRR